MTAPPATPSIPAGRHPDPTSAAQLRGWGGTTWTENVNSLMNAGVSSIALSWLRAARATVPAGTAAYSAFIWIVTLLPVISIMTLLTRNTAAVAVGAVASAAAIIVRCFDRKRLSRSSADLGLDRDGGP